MKESRIPWIEKGYELVARQGLENLKIEKLSKSIGISKSSFYHLFIDLDNFLFALLDYHFEKSQLIASKELQARSINPELIEILIDHRIDILFSKQIRIYRERPKFSEAISKIDNLSSIPFINVWKEDLKLNLEDSQLKGLFSLVLENFFLQVNIDNLEKAWLTNYFENLKILIRSIAN